MSLGPGSLFACHGGFHLGEAARAELEAIAEKICTPGKGITACDESAGTIGQRFEAVGVANTAENRRVYRQMLFTAPGATKYLSAAILDPETLTQTGADGTLFPEALMKHGIVPGVKPHLKVYELPGQCGSTVMQGLDSLAARCKEFRKQGARFTKWRSPFTIDVANGQPSDFVVEANMKDLARVALISQAEGLVPMVEPDIVLKGTHTLEQAVAINVKVQSMLYKAMLDHGVFMEGATLKTNIVNPGQDCPKTYTEKDIAAANLQVLRRCFPTAMRGVNFLSGGQNLTDAATRLSAINAAKTSRDPWNISFSWSAALQLPLIELCKGSTLAEALPRMAALYVAELAMASAASKGEELLTIEEYQRMKRQRQ